MKKSPILFLALSLLIAGCDKTKDSSPREIVLTASSSQDTPDSRVTINESDAKTCTWSENDRISVYTSSNSFKTFTLSSGAGEKTGKFTATLGSGETVSDYAIYPAGSHSYSNGTLEVSLPTSYQFKEGVSNIPMVSTVDDSNVLNFKHCGGVIRFGIKNLTVKGKFVFTSADKKITGKFPVTYSGGKPTINAVDNSSGSSVSISFNKPQSDTNLYYFYVPVPVGSYYDFTIEIINEDGQVVMTKNAKSTKNVVSRGTVLKMMTLTQPTFTGGNE